MPFKKGKIVINSRTYLKENKIQPTKKNCYTFNNTKRGITILIKILVNCACLGTFDHISEVPLLAKLLVNHT